MICNSSSTIFLRSLGLDATTLSPFFGHALLDLSKLINNPVSHDPTWPPVPTKLPSDIPKFEGKNGEDLGDHVITFNLWCSSNSLNDDSIRLRLFQRTLIGVSAKWYIELLRRAYGTFSQLVSVFLNHFQLPFVMMLA
jgi:hypothetical protein